jgi:hypothetical protein
LKSFGGVVKTEKLETRTLWGNTVRRGRRGVCLGAVNLRTVKELVMLAGFISK